MTAPTPKPRFKITPIELAVFFPARARARARSTYAGILAATARPGDGRRAAATRAGTPDAAMVGRGAKAAPRTSRYRWVSFNAANGKYVACVRSAYLGTFADEVAAARQADRKALEVYGEAVRPRLNFPDEAKPG
jgi:hypothetical protein